MEHLPHRRRSLTHDEKIQLLEFRIKCLEIAVMSKNDAADKKTYTIKYTPDYAPPESGYKIGVFNTIEDAQLQIPKAGYSYKKEVKWTYEVVEL